jgi:hypothetical protein
LAVPRANWVSRRPWERCAPPTDRNWRSRRLSFGHAPQIDTTASRGRAPLRRGRAFHAKPNAIKWDEITARQLHALKQHYTGKLRLPEIKEMFEQMKDRAQVRQAAPTC